MLLRRCAWCGKVLGVKWSRKWGVTHGICGPCIEEDMKVYEKENDSGASYMD